MENMFFKLFLAEYTLFSYKAFIAECYVIVQRYLLNDNDIVGKNIGYFKAIETNSVNKFVNLIGFSSMFYFIEHQTLFKSSMYIFSF